ncbi:MAG: GDSL-type esterase/lipase family protein [Bacillota bacterium]|nr:GDSL-type esterase/lipase family protein [Bacillota bacterium]
MKWVTNWANAISIATNKPEQYTKNITLRYPILSVFDGTKVRITLDNFTGKEEVHFEKITIAKTGEKKEHIVPSTLKTITFDGKEQVSLKAGETRQSDAIDFETEKNAFFTINIYLKEFTSLRAATTTLGPLSKFYYSLEDQSESECLPMDLYKGTEWVYFLSDIEIFTEDTNKSIVCFGDSITAQDWPEWLQLDALKENISVSFPRKAASGARILREYHNVLYESYGLKSDTRFVHDMDVQGCDTVIVLEGINDIIHPVGADKNPYRPWSDLPTAQEVIDGYRVLIKMARERGLKIYFGTIIPFKGWRTYAPFREDLKQEINAWIRTTDEIDGYIDFDKDLDDANAFKPEFDSGDHLHPSKAGYQQMAKTALEALKKYHEI